MNKKRPLIIGITGGTGSGKSTVCKAIIENIPEENIATLEQDAYYKDQSHLTFEERLKTNYDHPLSFDNKLLIKHLDELCEGKTIEKPVHEDITYDDVYDNLDNLWNFMFFTGYFKKISERMDENTQEKFVELAIPNLEVKYIFRTKILKWFNEKIKSEDLSILYTSIINGEVDVFQKEVNRLLKMTISFNDAYENFYHGFMIGLLSHMDGYIVKSNRETGDGRCDIYIKPLSIFDKAVIIEMKVCDKPKELFTKPQDALQQIEDMKYAYELNESGYEDIIKYGMAFYRKDCIIKIKE